MTEERLKLLREPFKPEQISKLPKPTKQQTDEVRDDFKKGIRCAECGGWHHPQVVHLDYVGHAALTDRLLTVDPLWNWEFAAVDSVGLPVIDGDGGFWIKLTVCGVTRLGYGDAQGKTGGNAMKERIGDALRNAAMRFGCALDLWHKGDLKPEGEVTTQVDSAKNEVADFFKTYNLAVSNNFDSINSVIAAIENGDHDLAMGAWEDIPEEDRWTIYRLAPTKGGILPTKVRTALKQTKQEFEVSNNG